MFRIIPLLAAFLCAANGAGKPDILFIFADDLGWKDVGYQGTNFYETPRIDALAASGMVFTDGGRENLATNNAAELYNLAENIGERINLANDNTAKRDELLDGLLAWFDKTGANLATEKK